MIFHEFFHALFKFFKTLGLKPLLVSEHFDLNRQTQAFTKTHVVYAA